MVFRGIKFGISYTEFHVRPTFQKRAPAWNICCILLQCQWGGILQGCCADSRYAQTATDVAVACCDVRRSANCSEYERYVVNIGTRQ